MLMKILKAFPYSHDGLTTRDLAADAVENIRDDLVLSLMEEGYVGEPEGAALAAPGELAPAPATAANEPTADGVGAETIAGVAGDTSGIGPGEQISGATADGDVLPPVAEPNPFDHDGDGKPGGSLPKAKRRSPKA